MKLCNFITSLLLLVAPVALAQSQKDQGNGNQEGNGNAKATGQESESDESGGAKRGSGRTSLPPKGLHHRLTPVVQTFTNELGQVTTATNTYWHLETGIHFQDEDGSLKESVAAFEIQGNYAVANKLQHKVKLAGNLNSQGAVSVTLPDGTRLRSHVSGLRYTDPNTGAAVVISEIKDSQATLVAPNQVVYPDAFKSVSADVRYTATIAGLEQDIILHEAPSAPETYGLDSGTARLELLTEFENPPAGTLKPRKGRQPEAMERFSKGDNRVEKEDVAVDFGKMRIGAGRAFRSDAGSDDEQGIAVGKSWLKTQKREFLVEAVEVSNADALLKQLPMKKGGAGINRSKGLNPRRRLQASADAIPGTPPTLEANALPIRKKADERILAMLKQPGLVLDYRQILVSDNLVNFTFQGDQTYYISGAFGFSGNTVIEGGAVIKFPKMVGAADGSIWIAGTLDCQTSPYRPAVFAPCDDNTIGQALPSNLSTGVVDQAYAYGYRALACWYNNPSWDIHDIRFIQVAYALYIGNQASNKIHNVQITNRGWPWITGVHLAIADFAAGYTTQYIGNVLFANLGTAVGVSWPSGSNPDTNRLTIEIENVTSDKNWQFCPARWWSQFAPVKIKNSIFGPMWLSNNNPSYLTNDIFGNPGTDWNNLGGNVDQTAMNMWSQPNLYTTSLAGSYYLAEGSPLHGTAIKQISSSLKNPKILMNRGFRGSSELNAWSC